MSTTPSGVDREISYLQVDAHLPFNNQMKLNNPVLAQPRNSHPARAAKAGWVAVHEMALSGGKGSPL
jgi:hypothetical protein